MKKIVTLLCLLVVSLAVFPTSRVEAHGAAGLTVTGTVDGYTGDVDYDYTVIEAGKPGRFAFNLFKGDVVDVAGTGVEYDDVWVRVIQQDESKNGKAIFTGPILKPLFGGTGMILTLPEAGEYTMHVRYNKDDTKIVEISYPITVYDLEVKPKFTFTFEFFVGLGGGFLVGILLLLPFLIFRKPKTKEQKEETDTK
jgi:hypothetical protein